MYRISQEHLDTMQRLLNDVTKEIKTGKPVDAALTTANLKRMQNILTEVSKGGKTTLDVDVGHGYISAERTFADGGLEAGIVIGFKEYNGMWLQDLVMAEHPFEEDEDGKVSLQGQGANCIVWADHNDEDWTHKMYVPKYAL